MKGFIQSLTVVLGVTLSSYALSIPTLDNLITTLGPLPNVLDSEDNYFSVSDIDGVDDDVTGFILNRNAGNSNTVGIYDPFNLGNTLELWSGAVAPGFTSGLVLNWDGTDTYTIEGTTNAITLSNLAYASFFGMYIESTDGGGNTNRWYSDPNLNPGQRDHLATFLTEGLGGATNAFDITFAWEDLDLGDMDYNDVIYGCIDCTSVGQPRTFDEVPNPGTVLLMGLGLLAFRFRPNQVG